MLELKQDKSCASQPTALPGRTDLQLHDAVQALLAQESGKKPGTDIGELRAERTRLLDKLRP